MATILVLDEASHWRDRVADALRELGHTIRTADHGVGGLRVLVQEGADLLLLGNELPRLHGMRIIDLIRCTPEWKNLPTILLVDGDQHYVSRLAENQGTGEPTRVTFSISELIERVESLFGGRFR